MLACLPVQIFWIDWSAVFNDYVCLRPGRGGGGGGGAGGGGGGGLLDPREMCFKDFDGIIQGKRNNGTAGFLGNLQRTAFEWQQT